MNWRAIILVVTAVCAVGHTQKLPSYIKACDFKSSDFKECAVEHANDAIPYIVKGDRSLGIPILDPLHLPLIEVEQDNFKLTLKDAEVTGLKDIRATSMNLDRQNFDAIFHIDKLNIIGTYNIDGKVLVLNLQGQGPANITAIGGDYHIKSALSQNTKSGLNYLKFGKPNVEFTLGRAYFDFGNLLNGDEKLGPEINQVLNDNWKDIVNDLGSPIKETISTIIETIVSNILNKVPADEILGVA